MPRIAWGASLLSLLASVGWADPSCDPITIGPTTLARPFYCLDYVASLTAAGGRAPYTYGVTGGSLPPGLALAMDGTLAGIASTPGTYGFTITATDADGCTGSASYLLPVAPGARAADDQVELVLPATGTGGSGDPQLDTVVSSLAVSGIASEGVAVTSLEVHVTLVHERVGDLVLTLVSPDGARIVLAERRGGLGQGMLGTIFSDAGALAVCDGVAPFVGRYRPEGTLGVRPANGTWSLEIADLAVGAIGWLIDWSLDVRTASAGVPRSLEFGRILWSESIVGLDTPAYQVVSAADHWYFCTLGKVGRVSVFPPVGPSSWTRTLPGAQAPLWFERSFASPLFAVNRDGWVYLLNPTDGTTLYARDLRRTSCTTDRLAPSAAVQLWSQSDCGFRAAVPSDLLFVGTHYECGSTTANRIYALDPSGLTTRWTFNAAGTNQVDFVTSLLADPARNSLYVCTGKTDEARSQNTVWALDTRTGAKLWSTDKGSILAPPLLADGLFVLSKSWELHKLDPATGATQWSHSLPPNVQVGEGMVHDATRGLLFVLDGLGALHALQDLGTSVSTLWIRDNEPLLSFALAPTIGRVYACSSNYRIRQIDELTGTSLVSQQFFSSPYTLTMFVDSTLGGGFSEGRLTWFDGLMVTRTRIPWSQFDFSASTGEDVVAAYAELTLQGLTVPARVPLGDTVTDTLTITNLRNHAPDCVVARATLPPGAVLVSASVPGGTASQVGDQLVARLGRVEIGESVVVTLTLRPGRGGTFTRTYSVASELPVPGAPDPLVTLTNEVWKVRRR